jgi:PIN like domain
LSFVFFTDRDLGKKFPSILSAAGLQVERHQDHFAPETSDEEWLEMVGKNGWVAVSHDQRIRYRLNERAAVVRHRVPLLVVVGKAAFPQLAGSFVNTYPKIATFLSSHSPPFIAKVYQPTPSENATGSRSGRVELWFPKEPNS